MKKLLCVFALLFSMNVNSYTFFDNVKVVHSKQGFINQFCQYRTRKEALEIVKANGQRFDPKRNGAKDELYSEVVW